MASVAILIIAVITIIIHSAQFQGMQKYPKKATKNPYKDTKNLIDNMDEDDY